MSSSNAAVVCGAFVRDNSFEVRSGSILVGGCDPTVDIGSLVEHTIAGGVIEQAGLLSHVSQPSTLALECGRYHFTSWGLDNTLAIQVQGDVVIVIDGDVRIASPTQISLANDARLDLVIGGNLEIDNTLTIAGGATWLAINGNVHVASPTRIDGWLVAPNGAVAADNTLAVDALLARSMHVASPVTVSGGVTVAPDGCTAP